MDTVSLTAAPDNSSVGAYHGTDARRSETDRAVFQYFLDYLISGETKQSSDQWSKFKTPAAADLFERLEKTSHGDRPTVAADQNSEFIKTQRTGSEETQPLTPLPGAMQDPQLERQLLDAQSQLHHLLGLSGVGPTPILFLWQRISDQIDAYVHRFDSQAFIQRIERFTTSSGHQGLRLVLWPEQLGKVEVTLFAQGQQLQVNFSGTPEFQQFVKEQWSELHRALADSGYTLASGDLGGGQGGQGYPQLTSDGSDTVAPVITDESLETDAAVRNLRHWLQNINYLQSSGQVLHTV